MSVFARQASYVLAVVGMSSLALAGCKKDATPALAESPPPPPASAKPAPPKAVRFSIGGDGNKVSVMIDAPLEKFKGDTAKVSGVLDVQPDDLKKSSGEIDADLDAFVTHTFNDKDKDESQTEHAHNWFELGSEVPQKTRDDYKMARFIIESIDETSVPNLAKAPEEGGKRTVTFKASGSLRVHGRASKKTVVVTVAFTGPAASPTELTIATKEPFFASLSEHDVKPRDLAGKFLQGALEKVGKKIDDKAQITIEAKAKVGDAPAAASSPSASAAAAPIASASSSK